MFRSSVTTQGVGEDGLPDIVYYNADIINNNTGDISNGTAVIDPPIRFNETRDKALIEDISKYHFSIIRFTMNGPNKTLPLFIPNIQDGTGQSNVNLTEYALAIPYKQDWVVTIAGVPTPRTFNIVPAPRFIIYEPETQNTDVAPVPPSMASPHYRGLFNSARVYQVGDIVTSTIGIYGQGVAPFFQILTPKAWVNTYTYAAGSFVLENGIGWVGVAPVSGVAPGTVPGQWTAGVSGVLPTDTNYWFVCDTNLGGFQDVGSRYYYVYTYQHWVNLVNRTLMTPTPSIYIAGSLFRPVSTCAYCDTYYAFHDAWVLSGTTDPFPYTTLLDFANVVAAPQMVMTTTPPNKRFNIYGDSNGFGQRILAFPPLAPGAVGEAAPPQFRLFFNKNLWGMFSHYDHVYYNVTTVGPTGPFGATMFPAYTTLPDGYSYEILFTNKFWQNIEDYRLPPYAGTNPLGYVPPSGYNTGTYLQSVYWLATQDYFSVDSLWSPISSIVFTSTLLPIKTEATGVPVQLGDGNLGFSSPVSQSAFAPIITDIALDTSVEAADDYRRFIYYAPSAEYRLSDFTKSKQDIRNIDIQVYWKNRLDNQLYPITMFNLSSVSVKIMFRKKSIGKESGY